MITRTLRWLGTLDRSYFFAISALVAAIAVSIALAFAPIATRADGSDVSLVERDGAVILILLALPLFVLASPLIALPQRPGPRERSHKINSVAATAVLMAFVLVSLSSFGLFYGPALIFSVASSVSLYFGRDRGTQQRDSERANYGTDSDGLRLSRGGRRRLREQERIAAEGGDDDDDRQGETPLTSSRRRRGRNRRKR